MKTKILIILLFSLTGILHGQYTPKQIDSMFVEARSYSDINANMDLDKALVLATRVYKHAKKINYGKGIGNSSFLIAAINYNVGNDKEVILYSSIAKEWLGSDKFQVIENLRIRAMSLINLGFITKAREELNRALMVTKELEAPSDRDFMSAGIFDAFCLSYDQEGEAQSKDSLFYYCRKAYKKYDAVQKATPSYRNIENSLALASVNLGSSYLRFNRNVDSVAFYLKKGLSLSKKNGHIFVECLANQDLGKFYFSKKEYQASIAYYLEALSLIKKVDDPIVRRSLYKDISDVYDTIKDEARAKEYLEKYVKLNDSITVAEKKALGVPIGQIIEEKEEEYSSSRVWYIIAIGVSVVLFLLFAYLSYLFFKKFRTEKMSNEEKELLLIEKRKKIERINNDSYDKLNEIIQLAINDNPVFYVKFQDVYPEFIETIKSKAPSLVLSELKCCALLKLNFSTKEIARFTNSTVRAIEQRKYRIRKKLDIPSDKDLNVWMMNL